MRKKYNIGGIMGSSSPLSSLMPQASPYQRPNFGNAFQFDPYALQEGIPLINNPIQDLQNTIQDQRDPARFEVGHIRNSSSPSQIVPSAQGNTFLDKFSKSTFGKDFGLWSSGLDIANTAFTKLFGEKSEYSGQKGNTTQTLDSTYDFVQNFAGNFGVPGQVLSLAMGGNKLLGNVANKLIGTSGLTTTDAILGSSFLQLTPLGIVNGVGGENADTITKDKQAFETVNLAYTGSEQKVNDALKKSGQRYGLLSGGDLKDTNRGIAEAKVEQETVSNVAKDSTDRFNIRNSMAAINGNKYALQLKRKYDQSAIRVGRRGLKVESVAKAKEILSKYKQQQTNQLQQGGTLDPFEHYLSTLPENQRDSTNFRVKDYWIFNGKPKDFKEARRRGMFTQEKDGWHASSIAENPETGEIEYMKASSHPTRYMESDWYEKGLIYSEDQNGNLTTIQLKPGVPGYEDWKKFTNDYELVKSEPYWKYVKRQQKEVPSHKEGGTFIELSIRETCIELIDPTSVPEFQNGGSINVIPDGALHARKHNMDVDGITRKGIPVVSEKDGEIEQQAEIERNEVILRLEVTQKLEELEKKFYNEESTQEEKDECALEAGKLLVYELLENTIDNTGLLNET